MITKASDIVVKNLLEAITKGELKPGGKVPTTQTLAQQSGTSVVSAREAVQGLATIGVLDICHGRGIFLTDGAPVMEELLEARRVLESHHAMMAAQSGSVEFIYGLEDILDAMDEVAEAGDIEGFSQKDIEFHFAIGKASGNRILFKTLMNIRNLLRYQLFTINRFPNIIQRSNGRHWEIFEAIRKRDPEKARSCMWDHMTETIDAWKEHMAVLENTEK